MTRAILPAVFIYCMAAWGDDFSPGEEEKKILQLAKRVEKKIPGREWNELATAAKIEKYVIQKGDRLWRISKKFFGSGFFYSKIWALNPHITNPHKIVPGMVLLFTTGTSDELPKVKLGSFSDVEKDNKEVKDAIENTDKFTFSSYGDNVAPPWITQRKKLLEQGIFFQYASEETYADLAKVGEKTLLDEYKKYDPPVPAIAISNDFSKKGKLGFDKSAKIRFRFAEGFYLNTFVTRNVVQDLGVIEGVQKDSMFLHLFDRIYVKLDDSVNPKAGDRFSVYHPGGEISHKASDRSGYRYTIAGQIRLKRKVNKLWEAEVFKIIQPIKRKDRLTVYTPKIAKIIRTFNRRSVEAVIVGSFKGNVSGLSLGDVVYLDRGRADGVEMGNIFEVHSHIARGAAKGPIANPTYKIGEMAVIALSDNFSTALITNSGDAIKRGMTCSTKTREQAAIAHSTKHRSTLKDVEKLERKALDELDVELNLDDISKDLLDKAEQAELTEDELEELERQEREKSSMDDEQMDLKQLERLENEIIEAETSLNESKVDEDKYLEQQNLNDLEKRVKGVDPNAFENLNDIEKEIGVKFLDESLNSKENPYGLTEFDLEEVDKLLNTKKL